MKLAKLALLALILLCLACNGGGVSVDADEVFPDAITDNYDVDGPLSVLPEPLFWICANLFFWLFWLNLMVGITNALPATPLDGGFIFRDGFDTLVKKMKKGISDDKREKIVGRYSSFAAYMILFLILWQLIAPHLTG